MYYLRPSIARPLGLVLIKPVVQVDQFTTCLLLTLTLLSLVLLDYD